MALHYPPDTEYRSLLLHENDFDFPDDPKFTPGAQWSSKITERRGIQLSHGVAQMLQLWPALLSNVLRTFVLILVACFVFVLAILTLAYTTNFSLIPPSYPLQSLHLQTRSIHSLPPGSGEYTQCRDHTETIHRYIITGSEDTVNLFYVIDQDAALSPYARKLLKFYVRAGYKVFLVRVCRTKFVDGEEIERGVFRVGGKSANNNDENSSVKNHDCTSGNRDQMDRKDQENEIDSPLKNSDKRSVGVGAIMDKDEVNNNKNYVKSNALDSKINLDETILMQNEKDGQLNVKLTAEGLVKEPRPSTADIETYDAKLRKDMASDFGQSREFFDRLRKILNKNHTFEEDEKNVELNKIVDKIPITSQEIHVNQTDDELKKVQVCTCPGCGHVKTRGRAIFGADWRDRDLARVELLNINYREFLRGSMFERHLTELDGNNTDEGKDGKNGEKSIFNVVNPDKEAIRERETNTNEFVKGGAARIDMGANEFDHKNRYDLNVVKLLLLWKFGNSLVLLDDQETLLHSKLIDRGRVNLGFHLIYSPYECASVIYNLMREYEREGNMRKTIGHVYRVFCKKAPRGFCNAIRYVQVKRKYT